jgi:radical SAM superfamily enzyme YgiQ (UPF0313 family)
MKRTLSRPLFLLVNPPVYDFAAYDLWAKPLGLLLIAAMLRERGAEVALLDCMDRSHPLLPDPESNAWGCGQYIAREVPKPPVLKAIPRRYKRYGMPEHVVRACLATIPTPDAILVTSGMTYWYPGVVEIIGLVKERYPSVPVILGGIYATLCHEHAVSVTGADQVIAGGDPATLFSVLAGLGFPLGVAPGRFSEFPAPAYDLYQRLPYAAVRTTRGCPYRCSYCAVGRLAPEAWERKDPDVAAREIIDLAARGVRQIAFYDDALFVQSESHILPLLDRLRQARISVCLHSPNGLHARYVTPSVARSLQDAEFVLPRLSLETASPAAQAATGSKVTNDEFLNAVHCLRQAGYRPGEYIAYLLIGMPGQQPDDVADAIRFAHEAGAQVALTEYSPVPGTRDWEKVRQLLPSNDPLWQNNSLFPLFPLSAWRQLHELKNQARKLNQCFT